MNINRNFIMLDFGESFNNEKKYCKSPSYLL